MQQPSLFNSEPGTQNSEPQSVTCLGIEFPSDEARRQHFTGLLRERLRDPEFRKIEGFPIGSDDDILNLSDPPYYTACPNPWVADFIAEWEAQKPEQPEGYHYHREPFAADVSEGKNDPIYNAHSYHTKVPHKAIMRYILHYTQPGDIVFDGFCGTGMTGVAAQMCGDREVVMSLGYQVKPDGTILQKETDEDGKKVWKPFSKLGIRRAVLNDLSPAATFIAYNYNTPVDVAAFEKEAKRILKEVEEECGWMYETKHSDGRTGTINYVVWSDVFVCPECAEELIFWDVAVNIKDEKVRDEFLCEKCNAQLSKSKIIRAWFSYFDPLLNDLVKVAKQKPVLINYSLEGFSGRLKKKPDSYDLALIEKINNHDLLKHASTLAIPKSDKTSEPLRIGITHTHLFYTSRNLIILDRIFSKGSRSADWRAHATALINTKMNRWPRQRGPLSLTLFVGSIVYENNVFKTTKNRDFPTLNVLLHNLLTTQSATHLSGSENSLDYIFIDPPFGSNIYYSDLNIVWETWLRLRTNTKQEAIESRAQDKNSDNYRALMKASFKNAYNMLKPGRWLTVEFSNTKASIWNSIQTAITEAGFIIANVSALDKKQGSFNAVTNTTSVKQDLVISAYKPNGGFEARFQKEAQTEEGVWDFVRTHLKYLPVVKRAEGLGVRGETENSSLDSRRSPLLFVPERDPRILFDQMIAFYVRKGYPVPISSQEFQIGLAQRFIERDGMYFLPDQVAEYDRKKMTSGVPQQLSLFVSDEASAIQWLRQLIRGKPQTISDINPQFMQQLGGWSKNEAQLDLRELLNQNFLCYDGKGPVPEQIHAYLSTNWKELRNLPKDDPTLVAKARDRWYVPDPNKAGDLEKLREKALLKEFEEYKEVKKKLKVFRLEAVRAGFKKAWQERDYAIIVAVADKIPNNVLEEDPKLLMWYDQAVTRMGGE